MDVKNIRIKALLTQEEFAKELGVSSMTIRRWELGKSTIRFPHQRKILEFCEKHNIKP